MVVRTSSWGEPPFGAVDSLDRPDEMGLEVLKSMELSRNERSDVFVPSAIAARERERQREG